MELANGRLKQNTHRPRKESEVYALSLGEPYNKPFGDRIARLYRLSTWMRCKLKEKPEVAPLALLSVSLVWSASPR